jgi:hypothetical protein
MARIEPRCRTKSGLGANLVTIVVYLSAFGKGGRVFDPDWVGGCATLTDMDVIALSQRSSQVFDRFC